MRASTSNPVPAANSPHPFCFLRLGEIRYSQASSEPGCPAVVAKGDRWTCRGSFDL